MRSFVSIILESPINGLLRGMHKVRILLNEIYLNIETGYDSCGPGAYLERKIYKESMRINLVIMITIATMHQIISRLERWFVF